MYRFQVDEKKMTLTTVDGMLDVGLPPVIEC